MKTTTDPEILIDRIDDLPSLTPIVSSVMSMIERGNCQAEDIGELLSADAALTSKILKVVNSAFYGLPQQVTSISKAVVMLGFDTIQTLVLSASVVELMIEGGEAREDLKLIWERSLFAAVTARKIAQRMGKGSMEECFMAGLLMDIGMLAQLKLHGEDYARVISEEIHEGVDIVVNEVQHFQVSHEHLGRALLTKWGIPEILTTPILYHHDLTGSEREPAEIVAICRVAHLARLASNIFFSPQMGHAIRDYKTEARRLLEMDPDEVDRFFRSIREEVLEVAQQYGIELKNLPSYTEILDQANQELNQINKTYEQLNRDLLAAQKQSEQLARSLRQANEKLKLMASKDELTGLYNRRYFEDFFSREFSRCMRYKRPMSCIVIDIDFFKKVNDTYGHLQGDSVLKELGERLISVLRVSDVAVRYGGEEFVVLLPETALYAARITGEKIRRAVAQDEFRYKRGQGLPITISVGIASFDGQRGAESHTDLLKQADAMLYRAKESGRNRCCHAG